jgi:hypothetical protein
MGGERLAVQPDLASSRDQITGQQLEERRFPGPVRADDGDDLAGPYRQVDVAEQGAARGFVGESDGIERGRPRTGSIRDHG